MRKKQESQTKNIDKNTSTLKKQYLITYTHSIMFFENCTLLKKEMNMKLQVSFDMVDLNKALEIATKIEKSVDIFELGSPLIYKNGLQAIKQFKNKFNKKKIFADIKMVDRVEKIIGVFAEEGTDYISILAGTSNHTIQNASKIAHNAGIKIALDLVDAYSMGQSAMDAQALDIDIIIFHGPHDSTKITDILEEWQNIIGNTKLPVFMGGKVNKDNIHKIIKLKPQGIIIGEAITKASNPAQESAFFKSLMK
jgi:3-hexulose-6-phosphate synthase